MKSSVKFFLGLLIIFVVLFLVEYSQDEPVDWSPGFGKTEKKPYGSYLLYEMLPDIYGADKIETIKYNIIDHLNEQSMYSLSDVNYIFINDQVSFDAYESDALLSFVHEGNNVFIASTDFPDTLLSSLALGQKPINKDQYYYGGPDSLYRFNFCSNLQSNDTGYYVRKDFRQLGVYLDSIGGDKKMLAADTAHHCLLAEVTYGSGKIILCSVPFTFTNYYMLDPATLDFVVRALSRLPQGRVWWDEHYKNGVYAESPLRFIVGKKSLKWAYYIGIGGLLLFVIFMGKRKQRVIPQLDPMKNASLEFAETVGQVYYEKSDHADLARKMVKYFYEYLRARYNVNAHQEQARNREEFLKNLSARSGKPEAEIQALFKLIGYVERTHALEEAQLIRLNTLIRNFKHSHQPTHTQ
jgi:hypothetical protein